MLDVAKSNLCPFPGLHGVLSKLDEQRMVPGSVEWNKEWADWLGTSAALVVDELPTTERNWRTQLHTVIDLNSQYLQMLADAKDRLTLAHVLALIASHP